MQKLESLLTFTWRGAAPNTVDETLAVYPNGEVWYWSAYPAEQKGRVGTFKTAVAAGRVKAVRTLAEQLLKSATSTPAPRGGIDYRASVIVDGHLRGFTLATGSDPAIEAAYQMGHTLAAEAEKSPLVVVRGSLSVVTGAQPTAQPKSIRLMLENIGTQSAAVLLTNAEITLFEAEQGATRQHWRGPAEGNTIGITNQSGLLLGGLYGAALIAAGQTGVLFLNNIYRPGNGATPSLSGQLEAYLDVVYPDFAQIEATPTTRFRLQTAPTAV